MQHAFIYDCTAQHLGSRSHAIAPSNGTPDKKSCAARLAAGVQKNTGVTPTNLQNTGTIGGHANYSFDVSDPTGFQGILNNNPPFSLPFGIDQGYRYGMIQSTHVENTLTGGFRGHTDIFSGHSIFAPLHLLVDVGIGHIPGVNRMTAFSGGGGVASYTYDGNGLRVVKSVSGGATTVSIFAGSSVIAEYDIGAAPTAPSREYIYNPAGGETTGLLAMISGGVTTYYHQDHLSARLTTNSSDSILSQEGSFPFGEAWYQTGRQIHGSSPATTGTPRADLTTRWPVITTAAQGHSARPIRWQGRLAIRSLGTGIRMGGTIRSRLPIRAGKIGSFL